jgi:multidrug efflux pump subunit AcrA (membrane-fusion protein)
LIARTTSVALGWTFSLGGPGRIEAAEARAAQADIALERFRDRLQASVAGSYQELALARQNLDPAQRELTAAEAALRIARANYEGGLLPENDLLLAQQAADQPASAGFPPWPASTRLSSSSWSNRGGFDRHPEWRRGAEVAPATESWTSSAAALRRPITVS